MEDYVNKEPHSRNWRAAVLRSRRGRLYRPIHKAPVEKAGGRAAERRRKQAEARLRSWTKDIESE